MIIHNIIAPKQFGFRKGISINNAAYKLLETFYQASNKKSHIAGIFCDLTKAFDCVSHELLLLCKLQYYGVRGAWLELIKSYLSDRKQRVDFKSSSLFTQSSQQKLIKCGVPQGSVLGPLFFNIYVNDFPIFLKKFSVVTMYANDTNLLISAQTLDDLTCRIDRVPSLLSN
jgi:hypothetical protein